MLTSKTVFPTACLAAAMILGCNQSGSTVDPARIARQRERFLSAEELADPVTVAEVRATIEKSEDPTATMPVVLIGQVGGVPNPLEETQPDFPWRANEATFYLVDQTVAKEITDHLAAAGPDHTNCPFCARRIAKSVDSMASVNFNNNKGKPVSISAQALFDLKANDVVVVEGEATLLGGKMLVVDAKKLYVKR